MECNHVYLNVPITDIVHSLWIHSTILVDCL